MSLTDAQLLEWIETIVLARPCLRDNLETWTTWNRFLTCAKNNTLNLSMFVMEAVLGSLSGPNNQRGQLTWAARLGDKDTIAFHLQNLIPATKYMCIHHAAQGNCLDTVKMLMDKGDVSIEGERSFNGQPYTPLTSAAQAGSLQTVEFLAQCHENWGPQKPQVALSKAAAFGHVSVVRFLLEYGRGRAIAPINRVDVYRALYNAVFNNRIMCTKTILRAESSSKSAIRHFLQWNSNLRQFPIRDRYCIQTIAAMAKIPSDLCTPQLLERAATSSLVETGDGDLVMVLLQANASPLWSAPNTESAFRLATKKGHTKIAAILQAASTARSGHRWQCPDKTKPCSALSDAVCRTSHNHHDCVRFLCGAKADVNRCAAESGGFRPLTSALSISNMSVVLALLKVKAYIVPVIQRQSMAELALFKTCDFQCTPNSAVMVPVNQLLHEIRFMVVLPSKIVVRQDGSTAVVRIGFNVASVSSATEFFPAEIQSKVVKCERRPTIANE